MTTVFRLLSEDLLSKWGFADGDLFWDWCFDLEREGLKVDARALLIAAVRRWLLPALEQKVEVVEIISIHNPIRATTVDGVAVTDRWFDIDLPPLLTPAWVDVSEADIWAGGLVPVSVPVQPPDEARN